MPSVLIEEAENHLSFSNLNMLIKHISEKRADRATSHYDT